MESELTSREAKLFYECIFQFNCLHILHIWLIFYFVFDLLLLTEQQYYPELFEYAFKQKAKTDLSTKSMLAQLQVLSVLYLKGDEYVVNSSYQIKILNLLQPDFF